MKNKRNKRVAHNAAAGVVVHGMEATRPLKDTYLVTNAVCDCQVKKMSFFNVISD